MKKPNEIILTSARVIVRFPTVKDIPSIIHYFSSNKEHLLPYSPAISNDGFFTEQFWVKNIEQAIEEFKDDKSLRLFIFLSENSDVVIGSISLTNITRGAFQACNLGYGLSKDYESKGLMSEALTLVIQFAFNDLNLHRIMANYMPDNKKSERILQKLGFSKEGIAKSYLFLLGSWQDHVLTSLVNNQWEQK